MHERLVQMGIRCMDIQVFKQLAVGVPDLGYFGGRVKGRECLRPFCVGGEAQHQPCLAPIGFSLRVTARRRLFADAEVKVSPDNRDKIPFLAADDHGSVCGKLSVTLLAVNGIPFMATLGE